MTHKDPIELLENYYANPRAGESKENLLEGIFAARENRKRRKVAAVSGFSIAAVAAAFLLAWASSPTKSGRNETASAIARYQMINSGLVESQHANGPVSR